MLKGLFIMNDEIFERVYSKTTQEEIAKYIDILGPVLTKNNAEKYPELLKEADVIFSGWGAPVFTQEFLELIPNLKVIFYAGGTMKTLLTDRVWEKGIRVTTANEANAVPVAEFTLAEILFSLKNGWQLSRKVRKDKTFINGIFQPITGTYGSRVGIVSLSQIGRRVINHLQNLDVKLLAYDPYVTQEEADQLNVNMCSLEELFEQSDVVSLHSPLLPETEGMITGELLNLMKQNATFINTARGAIIRENELIEVLKERPDLTALLDVTHPEPPEESSPLYTLENVIITPHIAGSVGLETQRLGAYILEEVKRYTENKRLKHEITKENYQQMA